MRLTHCRFPADLARRLESTIVKWLVPDQYARHAFQLSPAKLEYLLDNWPASASLSPHHDTADGWERGIVDRQARQPGELAMSFEAAVLTVANGNSIL